MNTALAARLQRLERLNRLLMVLMLGLAVLFVLGSTAQPESAAVVSGQRFELVDDQGKVLTKVNGNE